MQTRDTNPKSARVTVCWAGTGSHERYDGAIESGRVAWCGRSLMVLRCRCPFDRKTAGRPDHRRIPTHRRKPRSHARRGGCDSACAERRDVDAHAGVSRRLGHRAFHRHRGAHRVQHGKSARRRRKIPLSIIIAEFDEDARRRGSGLEAAAPVEAPAPASVVADDAPPPPAPRPRPAINPDAASLAAPAGTAAVSAPSTQSASVQDGVAPKSEPVAQANALQTSAPSIAVEDSAIAAAQPPTSVQAAEPPWRPDAASASASVPPPNAPPPAMDAASHVGVELLHLRLRQRPRLRPHPHRPRRRARNSRSSITSRRS